MAVQSQIYSEGFQDWSLHPLSAVHNNNNLCFDPNQTQFHGVSSSSTSTSFSSMAFNSELELQKREIDFILQLQNQKLRIALQEQQTQQLAALLSNLEMEASNLMKQKEEDLAQATRKAMELQERLRKAEMETEAWKRAATAKEAVAMGLHHRLEEARERQLLISTAAGDAESSCGSEDVGLGCKSCHHRNPCVVFLPCRHLCSCKLCEPFLGRCPVCNSVKEASMEVLLV